MKINPLVYVIGAWFAYRYYQSHKYNSSPTMVSSARPPTTPPPFFTTIPATHIPPAHYQFP